MSITLFLIAPFLKSGAPYLVTMALIWLLACGHFQNVSDFRNFIGFQFFQNQKMCFRPFLATLIFWTMSTPPQKEITPDLVHLDPNLDPNFHVKKS